MFKNASTLGAFGEFVYKRFCETHGVVCERTNYCHTDFLVTRSQETVQIYVDVKTTQRHTHEYRGKRRHSEIVYESISVSKDIVTLIPDEKSPFKDKGVIQIGYLRDLHQEWLSNEEASKRNNSMISKEEISELRNIFSKTKFPKVRIVERGDASQSRWTGTVDNLPGTDETIKKSDITLFIQYGCFDFQQIISSITIFPHELFLSELAPMLEPSQRQRNKGIKQVVDLHAYRNKHPEFLFQNLEKLKNFVMKSL